LVEQAQEVCSLVDNLLQSVTCKEERKEIAGPELRKLGHASLRGTLRQEFYFIGALRRAHRRQLQSLALSPLRRFAACFSAGRASYRAIVICQLPNGETDWS
jgi:hypothetical protein